MNRLFNIPLFLLVSTLPFSSCKENTDSLDSSEFVSVKLDTITLNPSMKGWELYSWPVNAKWKYSLLVGTNAVKTLTQVTNNPISVIGEDSLKLVINKLPKGEEIIWIGQLWLESAWRSNFGDIKLPPRIIQLEIKEYCDSKDIKLTIEE